MADMTTRERIVAEADRLFYERGYELTSFSDIADAVGISRGNFYYHFKSKDEILDAVIGKRMMNTSGMLETWETQSHSPSERIKSFILIVVTNRAQIIRHGCPVGTLCSELAKIGHPAQPQSNQLFALFRTWLCQQFVLLGHETDADSLAMHVLAFSQGIALLAQAFQDERFIQREAERMCAWLDGVADEVRV
ncbi:TetR/AcrR family transcriptional regulator [Pseudomonas sp. SWRI196]|uniref:TetR/AcrR family transcriptional regulator n=2 Tax=Pseudomonas tehranensis TaxID=2745502 RepID=A0ABR6UKZ6_9PSED|nr:TetR/AcrR family transcriptional regulator [Pseudomonas tehranensis]